MMRSLQSSIGSDDRMLNEGTPSSRPLSPREGGKLRFIEWIWNVKGSVPLDAGQSSDDAFDRLAPLFTQSGTDYERPDRATLTFTKKDQAAQDKMSIFDHGTLNIENGVAGAVLRYQLRSRALLFCFLAPFLFLGLAQLTVAVAKLHKPAAQAAKPKPEKAEVPMNPIDKFLGAPAPKTKAEKAKDKEEGNDKTPKPTPAYVFAGIFATLYVVGRILEDWLIKSLFRKKLLGG